MERLVKFAIVGAGATACHFSVVVVLVEMAGAGVVVANLVAWSAAFSISYFGHYHWTFSATGEHLEHLPRFVVVSVSGLGLNLVSVWLLHHQFGAHYLVATTIGVTLSIIVTFLASRFWAFAS